MIKEKNYLTQISLDDFQDILHLNDIEVDDLTAHSILNALQNNVYAIDNAQYAFILEGYLGNMVHLKPQSVHRLIHYFQPILTY